MPPCALVSPDSSDHSRDRPVERVDGRHVAHVGRIVTVRAERGQHPPAELQQGRPLQLLDRGEGQPRVVHRVAANRHPPGDMAVERVDREQVIGGAPAAAPGRLGDHVDHPGLRVVDRRPGDAGPGLQVRAPGNAARPAQPDRPVHPAGDRVDPVHPVLLGRGDHHPPEDQRLRVYLPAHPGGEQPAEPAAAQHLRRQPGLGRVPAGPQRVLGAGEFITGGRTEQGLVAVRLSAEHLGAGRAARRGGSGGRRGPPGGIRGGGAERDGRRGGEAEREMPPQCTGGPWLAHRTSSGVGPARSRRVTD